MCPEVSVVIPTTGRDQLVDAVRSVLAQQGVGATEIVLVVDGPEESIVLPQGLRPGDVVAWTGGGRGASYARNLGVARSRGELVAFLDDDDEWMPEKLSRQVCAARELLATGQAPVVATQHVQRPAGSDRLSKPVPLKVFGGGERIENYLFRRRRPGGGRASMYTSTLLTSRELAMRVPWDENLKRHQDWDWLVRAGLEPDVTITQLDWPGVVITVGSTGSISAKTDWSSSLAWADAVLERLDRKVYADFIVGQTCRYAIASRSLEGLRCVASRLWRRRVLPSPGPVLIALAGVIPRGALEKLMTRFR